MKRSAKSVMMLLAVAGVTGLTGSVMADDAAASPSNGASAPVAVSSGNPARDNLAKMTKLISFEFNEARLEDVMNYIAKETGVTFETLWSPGGGADGLDKEATVTMTVKDLDALTALEKVLDVLSAGGGFGTDASTWQFTSYGAMQVGPKKMLNRFKRVEVYDVNDLLFEIPVYDDVPEIDLQQALQGGGGGGGGRSPFGGGAGGNRNQQRGEEREERRRERISEIQNLITKNVEAEQWALQGGEGGTIDTYEGHFVVSAPDYLHRALVGYSWWPSKSVGSKGKRFVLLNVDAANTGLRGVENFPTSAAPGATQPGGGR
jgi:hypothetical protein